MTKKILIIDDDPDLRQVLKIMLNKEGFLVSEAENGLQGIEKFKDTQYDLIITDIIMPEKEGFETILELKQLNPDIKIIAMSGGGKIPADDYLNMATNFGVCEVMVKPFKKEDFILSVKSVL